MQNKVAMPLYFFKGIGWKQNTTMIRKEGR